MILQNFIATYLAHTMSLKIRLLSTRIVKIMKIEIHAMETNREYGKPILLPLGCQNVERIRWNVLVTKILQQIYRARIPFSAFLNISLYYVCDSSDNWTTRTSQVSRASVMWLTITMHLPCECVHSRVYARTCADRKPIIRRRVAMMAFETTERTAHITRGETTIANATNQWVMWTRWGGGHVTNQFRKIEEDDREKFPMTIGVQGHKHIGSLFLKIMNDLMGKDHYRERSVYI